MFELISKQYNNNIIKVEKICNIINNIYVGNNLSRDYINIFNIEKVFEIGTKDEIKEYKRLSKKIEITSLIINEKETVSLIKYFDKIWDFFEYNYNKNILIHCKNGYISILFLISYLVAYKYYTYDAAFELINTKMNNILKKENFNQSYINELIELDKSLHNFKYLINIK